MSPVARLAEIVRAPGCAVAPGAFDAWSARLIARAGFEICYMTGFGAAAAHLGAPDIGLMSGSEVADIAGRITEAVDIPVIADADTGYGSPLNVRHTARAYARAGVAGLQLEDQDFPKRCGHLEGKTVVETGAMVDKIRAVKDTVGDEMWLVARTDARAPLGLDEALARGRAFAEAGADIVFVEAPQNRAELDAVCGAGIGAPLIANMVEGGKTPYLDADTLGEIGFALAIFPITGLLAATGAMERAFAALRADGKAAPEVLASFDDLHAVSGLADYLAYAARFDKGDAP